MCGYVACVLEWSNAVDAHTQGHIYAPAKGARAQGGKFPGAAY
jgi:hypothetical protein